MIEVRSLAASETWPLRQSQLRPHQTVSEMLYPGDLDDTTRHFGAFSSPELVGIASLYRETLPERPAVLGWRLRGMAVLPNHRRSRIGATLVDACLAHARSEGGGLLWCNARENALAFYGRLGFTSLKGPFEIPGIGPHFLLILPL